MRIPYRAEAGAKNTDEINHPEGAGPGGGWRQSRWLVLGELTVVAAIFIADYRHLIPVSKTPFLLALAWLSLWLRRIKWHRVGFALYRNWSATLRLGIGGGIILEAFQLLVTQPLLVRLTARQPDLSDFRLVRGNIKYTLIGIALSWTLAAFGEELAWRGYLLNRVADLGNHTRLAWIFSLLLVSGAFGLAHLDQGVTGQVEEAIAGLFLGAMYVATGKNLAVPIAAHGAADTVDMLLLFLGKYPGT